MRESDENGLLVHPPIYLVGMVIHCWKCDQKMPVVTLVAPNIEEADGEVVKDC